MRVGATMMLGADRAYAREGRLTSGPAPRRKLSEAVDIEDGLSEVLGCLLRHVVTDLQRPVVVVAREPVPVGCAIPGWGKGVVFSIEGDRGYGDAGTLLQSILESLVSWVAFGEAQPPAV